MYLFPRKYFRFNYQLLWSQQDQPAFAAFHNHFTADECVPFIIKEHNDHPYFLKLDTITKQALDYICFNPRLITENKLLDDNRPYRYEQNFQEQQDIFPNDNYDEDDANNEEYMPEIQNENRNDDMALKINENNAMSIPLQNLKLRHKMHHKLRHQQLPDLLEFQLGLLVQDKTHKIHNHTQIQLHNVT